MSTTFQNTSMVLSIGIFFSLMIAGLAALAAAPPCRAAWPRTAYRRRRRTRVAGLPPVVGAVRVAARLQPGAVAARPDPAPGLPADHATYLTGHTFFPSLISGPFHDGLMVAFAFAIVACLVAAVASWFASGRSRGPRHESVGGSWPRAAASW